MMKLRIEELPTLCHDVRTALPDGGIVVLQGDLASGKTAFTQAFAAYLGLEEPVTSPTFSLQQSYGERLYHYDLYNYGFEKFLSMGMLEELEKEGYHLIEWGDESLIGWLKRGGFPVVILKIEKCDDNARCYEVKHA